MDFQPYTENVNGGLHRWTDKDCKRNKFRGMEPIEGEENDDWHVVIIKEGRVHCNNLVDEKDTHFDIDARAALPIEDIDSARAFFLCESGSQSADCAREEQCRPTAPSRAQGLEWWPP